MSERMKTWLKRGGMGITAGAVLFTGLMGFAHTKAGRPLLRFLGMGCPAMKLKPEQVEQVREAAVARLRGSSPAAARPALGLALDTTTLDSAKAWASGAGVHCEERERPTLSLACTGVSAAAMGEPTTGDRIDALTLSFDPAGRLIQVDTWRDARPSADAERIFGEISGALAKQLGAPTTSLGARQAAVLDSAALRMDMVDYRFSDYLANVAAANMGGGRIVVRESYRSAATHGS